MRARWLALALAVGCAAYLPYRAGVWNAGAAAPMFETLFTLIFVAAAVFLAAGSAVLGASASILGRLGLVLAPLLLAMYARGRWPQWQAFYFAVPALAAAVLAAQSRLGWQVLQQPAAAPTPP